MPSGRKKNARKPKTCTVSLAPEIYGLLERIANSGYSARTVPTVADEMIRRGLDNLDANGIVGKLLHERIAGGGEPK